MKKLSMIKLNQLSKAELDQREMNIIRGGDCSCECGTYCATHCSPGLFIWYDSGAHFDGPSEGKFSSARAY